MMQVWGAECLSSPTDRTKSGRAILEKDPNTPGSLGIAISEAVEDALSDDNTHYALGSVLNHVCLHQTIIGLEAKRQFEQIDEYPDVIFGCVGGGSNFSGTVFPFLYDKIKGKKPDLRVVACESMACPKLKSGLYTYDFGDQAGLTPLLKMFTLGHDFVPPPIHAGGLRYHGNAPLLCNLYNDKLIDAVAYYQTEVFNAAITFANTEGFIVAPESAHAIKAVIDEALRCKKDNTPKTILFNNSGHGYFDLSSYEAYFDGRLVDYEYPAELVKQSLERLPKI